MAEKKESPAWCLDSGIVRHSGELCNVTARKSLGLPSTGTRSALRGC